MLASSVSGKIIVGHQLWEDLHVRGPPLASREPTAFCAIDR
jgi:hypothetical protein